VGEVPRGIEVLVKKAAVDPAFRARLLEDRAAAAEAIGLRLTPTETLVLRAVPQAQLQTIIDRTRVHPRLEQVFRGAAAGLMLAALGASQVGCPPLTTGIEADRPPAAAPADQPAQEPLRVAPSDGQASEPPPPPPNPDQVTRGIRPDRPPVAEGIRPDRPKTEEAP
jgi:hypothetical protein